MASSPEVAPTALYVPPEALSGRAVAPLPVTGCDVCGWWEKRRENARRGIGEPTVEECDRQIAAHPHLKWVRPCGLCCGCGHR